MILLYSGAAESIMSKIENFIQECHYVARIGSTFDPADLKKKSVGCLSDGETTKQVLRHNSDRLCKAGIQLGPRLRLPIAGSQKHVTRKTLSVWQFVKCSSPSKPRGILESLGNVLFN